MVYMPQILVPTWLDRNVEIAKPDQPDSFFKLKGKDKDLGFILWSLKELFALPYGLTNSQAVGVVANSCVETGWGKYWSAYNFGGVKITKNFVENYKKTHGGKSPSWWRKPGHVASGDAEECYYRAYGSPKDFYDYWVTTFVPNNGSSNSRYYETGKTFWAGLPWFEELCKAGYKGPVTAANPQQSVRDFEGTCRRVKVLISQHVIGVKVDANWGNESRQACKKFLETQKPGETFSGDLDGPAFRVILEKWKNSGCKLSFVL